MFTVVIGALSVVSCEKETASIDSDRLNVTDLEFVGIEHNVWVENMYEFLLLKSVGSKKTTGSYIANIKFYESKNVFQDQDLRGEYEKVFQENKFIISNKKDSEIYYSKLVDLNIEKLLLIIRSNDDVILKIKELENNINQDLSFNNEELFILFSATQTAKNSYIYWTEENINKWENINSELGKSLQPGPNGGNTTIVEADVAGAVGGAVAAALINFVPFLGQAAYGSWIVGSAAVGSVSHAILN